MADDTINAPAQAQEAKQRLTKKLPTFRAGFAKQLDALRAYAVLSENGIKGVHYGRVADIIKIHEANVSSMNPFFLEAGFIEKDGNGYKPTAPVIEYNRAHSWNPETAAEKLAPVVTAAWFGQALTNHLLFRAMSEEEAIEMLASECMAGPDAKQQLRTLIDFCAASGIIERNNGQLAGVARKVAQIKPQPTSQTVAQPQMPSEPAPALPAKSTLATPMPAAGGVNFEISVNVDMAQMRNWSADRIAAFFSGIAQVLAAQQGDKQS